MENMTDKTFGNMKRRRKAADKRKKGSKENAYRDDNLNFRNIWNPLMRKAN